MLFIHQQKREKNFTVILIKFSVEIIIINARRSVAKKKKS